MSNQRGDTLIEVLIAVSVLAAAIVGGLAVMNQGYSIASNAVERTQVQGTMNGQLSIIRYARDAFLRANQQGTDPGSLLWVAVASRVTTGTSSDVICSGTAPQPGANSFSINADNLATLTGTSLTNYTGTAATTLATPGRGMWIEARRAGGAPDYIDFTVKSCWEATGSTPQQESKTAMRLYVPAP